MRVAVIGAGQMGSAIGATLARHGAEVMTPLEGRTPATRQRAQSAGMRDASWSECAASDVALSIVASSQALPVAQRFVEALDGRGLQPVFVECNAIQPERTRAIAALFEGSRAGFADAGIVGGPPASDGTRGPLFYLSGPAARQVMALADFGLAFECLDAPTGAASALKLCLAGTSKGQTALLAMMTLLAEREGVREPYLAQLARSHPGFLAWARRQAQRAGDVCARWADEMHEIAPFAASLPGASEQYAGLERFFAFLADRSGGDAAARLKAVLED